MIITVALIMTAETHIVQVEGVGFVDANIAVVGNLGLEQDSVSPSRMDKRHAVTIDIAKAARASAVTVEKNRILG